MTLAEVFKLMLPSPRGTRRTAETATSKARKAHLSLFPDKSAE
jgi:hypothetical protein